MLKTQLDPFIEAFAWLELFYVLQYDPLKECPTWYSSLSTYTSYTLASPKDLIRLVIWVFKTELNPLKT